MQDEAQQYVLIADVQALTDHYEDLNPVNPSGPDRDAFGERRAGPLKDRDGKLPAP